MATNENTFGRSVKTGVDILVGIAVLVAIVFVALPFVKVPSLGDIVSPQPTIQVQPTPRTLPPPRVPIQTGGSVSAPVSVPSQIESYNATATAQYQEAINAPVENVGQSAPVVINSKPAESRQPAGDNVPTAEQLPQPESGSTFGSKRVLVNPQETHQCLHGQKWVDGKGCKNP